MPEYPPELKKELEEAARQFEEEQSVLTFEDLLKDPRRENINRYLDQRIENVIQEMATREAMLLKLKDPAAREKIVENLRELLSEKVTLTPQIKGSRRESIINSTDMQRTVLTRLESLKKGMAGASPEKLEKGLEKMIESKIQQFKKTRKPA